MKKLQGANMDIDLATDADRIKWAQDQCPWNAEEDVNIHRCAVKNVSICEYFRGIEYLDTVLCSYGETKEQADNLHDKSNSREVTQG